MDSHIALNKKPDILVQGLKLIDHLIVFCVLMFGHVHCCVHF
jgi:hypothetical protein